MTWPIDRILLVKDQPTKPIFNHGSTDLKYERVEKANGIAYALESQFKRNSFCDYEYARRIESRLQRILTRNRLEATTRPTNRKSKLNASETDDTV